MDREKLLDVIMKNHRMAESARQLGNEAEALAFAEVVQRLLLKHDLELEEVQYQAELAQDPVRFTVHHLRHRRRAVLWSELLTEACATAHLCHAVPVIGSDSFVLIGRRQHREVAHFMIITLVRLAEQLADTAYTAYFYQCKAEGDVAKARGYRNSFLFGFAVTLKQRYRNLMLEVQQVNRAQALIRLSSEVTMVQDVVAKLTEAGMFKAKLSPGAGPLTDDGFEAGAVAATKVELRGKALAQAKDRVATRMLGSGA